jgi:hypothetical protein
LAAFLLGLALALSSVFLPMFFCPPLTFFLLFFPPLLAASRRRVEGRGPRARPRGARPRKTKTPAERGGGGGGTPPRHGRAGSAAQSACVSCGRSSETENARAWARDANYELRNYNYEMRKKANYAKCEMRLL